MHLNRTPPDDRHPPVERGGHLLCAPPTDARQRAHLCSMAWGLSVAFGGDGVRVQDYLPGLHLDIHAQGLPPPQQHPARRVVLDWDRVDRTLWNALNAPWREDAIVVQEEEWRCVIHQQGSPRVAAVPPAFTLRQQWPRLLGNGARPPAGVWSVSVADVGIGWVLKGGARR